MSRYQTNCEREWNRDNGYEYHDYYEEKLDRWREEWNREIDRALEEGR